VLSLLLLLLLLLMLLLLALVVTAYASASSEDSGSDDDSDAGAGGTERDSSGKDRGLAQRGAWRHPCLLYTWQREDRALPVPDRVPHRTGWSREQCVGLMVVQPSSPVPVPGSLRESLSERRMQCVFSPFSVDSEFSLARRVLYRALVL